MVPEAGEKACAAGQGQCLLGACDDWEDNSSYIDAQALALEGCLPLCDFHVVPYKP